MNHLRCVGIGALVWLLGLSVAWGHAPQVDRTVVLQRDGRGLVALVTFGLEDTSAELLWNMHDLDRNGRLSGTEGKVLARALVLRAVSGLGIWVSGELTRHDAIQAKLVSSNTNAKKIEAVGLLSLGSRCPELGCEVELRLKKGYGKVEIAAQGLGGWSVHQGDGTWQERLASQTLHERGRLKVLFKKGSGHSERPIKPTIDP